MHVALFSGAGNGYVWGVRTLLDANADPSILDKSQRSVLDYAKEKKQSGCVQAIEVSRAHVMRRKQHAPHFDGTKHDMESGRRT